MADQIWICEKQTVTKWEGDIIAYKEHLKDKVMADIRRAEKKAMTSNGSSASLSKKGSSASIAKKGSSASPSNRGNW